MNYNLIEKGYDLIKQASNILESISNNPGVTSVEFCDALDLAGISCKDERDALWLAAANIELSLELVSDKNKSTVH